jgi:sarcosine oxidase
MADTSSDIAVVGAGIVGLSVTHALRERGVDVVCLDDAEPGHGQSAGPARIFRHYLATPQLAALAVEARSAWDAWSQRAGEPLLLTDGWLRLGGDRPADLAFLRDAGIPATELEPDDAVARMPVMARPVGPLLFDPLAGSTRTDATIAVLVGWVGSALRRARVERVDVARGSAVLRTSEGTHTCAQCLVCAGAGTDRLAATAGVRIVQHRRAHMRLTFRRRTGVGGALPSWSDRSGIHGEMAYGVPTDGETYGLGIAEPDAYPVGAPGTDAVAPGTDLSDARRRIVAYVRSAFPGLDPEPVGEVVRLTTTLDGREEDAFAIRQDGPVAAFAGGNLFKFAPVLGIRLAGALLDGGEVWPGGDGDRRRLSLERLRPLA